MALSSPHLAVQATQTLGYGLPDKGKSIYPHHQGYNLIKHVNGKLLLLFTIAKITIQNEQHLQN